MHKHIQHAFSWPKTRSILKHSAEARVAYLLYDLGEHNRKHSTDGDSHMKGQKESTTDSRLNVVYRDMQEYVHTHKS